MFRVKVKRIYSAIQIIGILVFLTGCAGEISNNVVPSQILEAENLQKADANVEEKDCETVLREEDNQELLQQEQEEKNTDESMEISTEMLVEIETEVPTEEPIKVATEILGFEVEEISEILYPNRSLNVRTGPSTEYDRIGSVYLNQELHVTGVTENGWYKIDYNGQSAYCSGYYLEKMPITTIATETTGSTDSTEKPVDSDTLEVVIEEPTIVSTGTPVMPETVTASATVNELFAAVNADRAANGIPALVLDVGLQNTAAIRASEISILFDHIRPDGSTCFTAFPADSGASKAENIYMISVATTADAVEAAWMASAGHQANILNAKYTKIGIGIYQASNGYWYFVQDFSN